MCTCLFLFQAITIPDAKAAVDREWEKLEKLPAWQVTQVQSKKEAIGKAQKEGRTVHFATLMDFCHLKNSELQPQFQKYKRRIVLRGDAVKDDSGSDASFTEQGSSASQMTAAKGAGRYFQTTWMLWTNKRRISVYTHVKMEDDALVHQSTQYISLHPGKSKLEDAEKAPTTQLKLLKFECPGIWIRLRRYTWPRRLAGILTNQWFLQRGICTDIPLQDCNGRDSSKRFFWKMDVRANLVMSVCSSPARIVRG